MAFANAYNETHQWARTITLGSGSAPTKAGQFVTLSATGWDLAVDSVTVDSIIKMVKSVDDLSKTDSGAFVRGASVSSYKGKVTVYWDNFIGATDNVVTTSVVVGDELELNSSGVLIEAAGAGAHIIVAVVEEIGISDDETDSTGGLGVLQVQPYLKTIT